MSYDDYIPPGFPNRTMCDVLEEMRKCYECRNFSPILGLIEEVQIMGSRMEAKLEDQKDLRDIRDRTKEAREELKTLKNELKLTNKIKELK